MFYDTVYSNPFSTDAARTRGESGTATKTKLAQLGARKRGGRGGGGGGRGLYCAMCEAAGIRLISSRRRLVLPVIKSNCVCVQFKTRVLFVNRSAADFCRRGPLFRPGVKSRLKGGCVSATSPLFKVKFRNSKERRVPSAACGGSGGSGAQERALGGREGDGRGEAEAAGDRITTLLSRGAGAAPGRQLSRWSACSKLSHPPEKKKKKKKQQQRSSRDPSSVLYSPRQRRCLAQ